MNLMQKVNIYPCCLAQEQDVMLQKEYCTEAMPHLMALVQDSPVVVTPCETLGDIFLGVEALHQLDHLCESP